MSTITSLRANFGQALQPVLHEAATSPDISPARMDALVEGVMDKVGRAEDGEAGWRTEVRRTTVDSVLEDIIISVVSLCRLDGLLGVWGADLLVVGRR